MNNCNHKKYKGEVAIWSGEEYFGTFFFDYMTCLECEYIEWFGTDCYYIGTQKLSPPSSFVFWLQLKNVCKKIHTHSAIGDEREWWFGAPPRWIVIRDKCHCSDECREPIESPALGRL